MALVGASAAGYARSGESLSHLTGLAATFNLSAVPAAAVTQDDELRVQSAGRDAPARAATVRAAAAADQVKAATAAAAARTRAAAAAQVAAIAAQRQAETDRVARDAQRVALVTTAQNDPRSVARTMLGNQGWDDGQWSCLEQLWVGESGWNYKAENPSGAYGIPQSLPGSKMASVGADYRTNPITQITWGMAYIKRSYGSPCSALSTWNSRYPHWY